VSVEADVQSLVAATVERFGQLACAFNNASLRAAVHCRARRVSIRLRNSPQVDWPFVFASAAFNLIRFPKLLPRPA
jgi:NAD(P)-dependent dehydrogenase (short-subunit alcohol dehydrogenase family)